MTSAPPSNGPRPGQAETLRAGAILAAIWLALWLGGYPRPNVDDGFFAGAGIHLAETGRLNNPWITGWMGWLPGVHADRFLLQPPLYPLVLAGWLMLAGISTASLTGFGCSLGLASSLAVWVLFRRLSSSAAAAWLAAGVVGAWLLFRGLRPESLALLLVVTGQLALLHPRGPAGWFLGGMLGSAAVLAHPFWVVLVVPGTLLQITGPGAGPAPGRHLGSLAAGIVLVAGAFVLGLGDNYRPFIQDLTAHVRFVAPAGDQLKVFLAHFQVGYDFYRNLIVVGLALLCLLWGGRSAWTAGLAWLGVQLLGFYLYAAQSAMFLILLAGLVPLLLCPRQAGWRRRLHFAPALILLAWYGAQHSLQWLADRQHDHRARREDVLAYLAANVPSQVVFDATTLRTVFDYRPPAGAVDLPWAWSPGRADRWWSPDHLAARDCWVVNPVWSRNQLPREAGRNRLVLLGRTFESVRSSRALLLVIGPGLREPRGLPFIVSPRP